MLSLGIDTSNYTTSAALADGERILEDNRTLLRVKPGEKGLRQSDALFQHWQNLPDVLDPILERYRGEIGSVTVSVKPRPQEGSYMPVFTAGLNAARVVSAALGIPLRECSHQEGHLAAAALGSGIDLSSPFIFAHLSGGTLELVKAAPGSYEILAATSDISYGQLLDRCAVMAGFPFPGGKYMDGLAMERLKALGWEGGAFPRSRGKNPFAKIYKGSGRLNLSGLENQFADRLKELGPINGAAAHAPVPAAGSGPDRPGPKDGSKDELLASLCFFLMERVAESFAELADELRESTGIEQVLLCGGVASSAFLRAYCADRGYFYGSPGLCSDNAVGCALIGGRAPWH